jgi:hypothetical protein
MSSIGIATLGMFDQGTGGDIHVAGGVIHVPEEKPKPTVKLVRVTTVEQISKKKIEIKSVSSR